MTDDPILSALQEQVDGYRKLARLAEAQRKHVQTSNTEALLDVLNERQAVLDRIMAAEQIVSPAKRTWTDFAAKLSADQKATAERMLGETRQLLEQITVSDRDDVVVLQQRKLNLGRQIDRAATARSVNLSYAAAAYGTRRPTLDLQQ
jgi:hypothetical protein